MGYSSTANAMSLQKASDAKVSSKAKLSSKLTSINSDPNEVKEEREEFEIKQHNNKADTFVLDEDSIDTKPNVIIE
jgi:hypothetical protein